MPWNYDDDIRPIEYSNTNLDEAQRRDEQNITYQGDIGASEALLKQHVKLADRFNIGKTEWSLVDFPSIEPMARVLMFGAKKYAPNNWKKGLKVTETIDSLMRHLVALNDGEDNDPESKLPHIGHILCNAMFLSYMLKNRPDLDNRHKAQD